MSDTQSRKNATKNSNNEMTNVRKTEKNCGQNLGGRVVTVRVKTWQLALVFGIVITGAFSLLGACKEDSETIRMNVPRSIATPVRAYINELRKHMEAE